MGGVKISLDRPWVGLSQHGKSHQNPASVAENPSLKSEKPQMGAIRIIFRSLYLRPGKSHEQETWTVLFGCPYSTIWYQEPQDPHENPGTTWHPQSVLLGTYGLEWTGARNRHVVGKVKFQRGRWWFRGLRFPFSCWVMAVFVETAIYFFCALTPPRLVQFSWKLVSRRHLACQPQTPKTLPKP